MCETIQSKFSEIYNRSPGCLKVAYHYGIPTCTATLSHPLTYARVLMMLGYEPDPPVLRPVPYTLIRQNYRCLLYPTVFTYLHRLREQVGLLGVFTIGLPASILGGFVKSYVTDSTTEHLIKRDQRESFYVTDCGVQVFLTQTSKLTAARVLGVTVSYPLQVVMIRQMAQSVGDEILYRNVFSAIYHMAKEEGILSLFNGLIPRLIAEVITVWMISCFVYVLNEFVFDPQTDPSLKKHTPLVGSMAVSNTTHPLTVTSTVMAISGSRLSLGLPFDRWWNCYSFLSKRDCLTRGSSLFFRYAPMV